MVVKTCINKEERPQIKNLTMYLKKIQMKSKLNPQLV